tara:strand:- start:217 stop:462 length:246 start_codon:yes stop_codon:yes gene_type:complete
MRNEKIRRMSIDEIGKLPDDEVERLISKIKNLMSYKPSSKTTRLQVEMCYLQRENEIRKARKRMHVEYLKNFKNKQFSNLK